MSTGKLISLDDGLQVYAASAIEARFIYQEIFQAGCYDLTGLPEAPFVVDVGANIGIFSLFVAGRYPAARILAFEPMPHSAALLRRNLARHGIEERVAVHELALGRAAEPGVTFTYYPVVPGNSTRHPETRSAAKAVLAQTLPVRVVERMYQGREVTVEVERLAAFLPPERAVDLLKVDVEGAEVDVLRGVDRSQWPWIRRVVAEVHDQDGRLDAACELLRHHGLAPMVRPATEGATGAYVVQAVAGS